jgi:4-hydroxy-3-methylbut-2-en-1-yl diphosphate synthase IspG/GcpE
MEPADMQPSHGEPVPLAGARVRRTRPSSVSWGSNRVTVGGDAPVRVQSMTNTDTVDVIGTAILSWDDVYTAWEAGGQPVWIPVAKQTNNQLLMIKIAVVADEG